MSSVLFTVYVLRQIKKNVNTLTIFCCFLERTEYEYQVNAENDYRALRADQAIPVRWNQFRAGPELTSCRAMQNLYREKCMNLFLKTC